MFGEQLHRVMFKPTNTQYCARKNKDHWKVFEIKAGGIFKQYTNGDIIGKFNFEEFEENFDIV